LVSPVRFEGMRRYEELEVPVESLREMRMEGIIKMKGKPLRKFRNVGNACTAK